MFGLFHRATPAPSPPVTPEEQRIRSLVAALRGTSYKDAVYLWGLAAHRPGLLRAPDPVTAAAVAPIARTVGTLAWEVLVTADAQDLAEACNREVTAWRAAAFMS